MHHVERALENLQQRGTNGELSVLQRVLEMENDTKMACILALDMFLVGIDTVSNLNLSFQNDFANNMKLFYFTLRYKVKYIL